MTRPRPHNFSDWLVLLITVPTAPLWIPVLCIVEIFRCLRDTPSADDAILIQHNATRPIPLPYSRPSNLSDLAIQSNPPPDNAPSPFLRLPYSVRRQIYAHIFADRYIIRIGQSPKRPYRLTSVCREYPVYWPVDQHTRRGTADCPLPIPSRSSREINLGLLRTCRQLYSEGIPLVYSTNTFVLTNLSHLIYLNQCVLPRRLAQIRYLQVQWTMHSSTFTGFLGPYRNPPHDTETWERFWNIVATRLVGLRECGVRLEVYRQVYELEKVWLRPMGRLRGLKWWGLEVEYVWDEEEVREEVRGWREEVARRVKLPRGVEIEGGDELGVVRSAEEMV